MATRPKLPEPVVGEDVAAAAEMTMTGGAETAKALAAHLQNDGIINSLPLIYVTFLVVLAGIALKVNAPPGIPFAVEKDGSLRIPKELLVQMVAVVTFFVAMLFSAASLYWASGIKRRVARCVIFINIVVLTGYVVQLTNVVPQVPTAAGETMRIVRFMDWFLTTPTLVTLMSCLVRRVEAKRADELTRRTVLANMVMIAAGAADRYYSGFALGYAFLGLSSVAFMVVMHGIYRLFEFANSSVLRTADVEYMNTVMKFTFLVWCGFPIMRLLNIVDILDDSAEEILYTMLDILAKVAYSTSLLVVNYSLFDNVLELRLVQYEEAMKIATARGSDGSFDVGLEPPTASTQKEVAEWRTRRESAMREEGMSESRTIAFLDAALSEYMALARGDVSQYLT